MLFTSEEKNWMVGAFTAGGIDAALESYVAYRVAGGYNIRAHPEDPLYWLYYTPNEWIPSVDNIIAYFGVPLILWGIGKKKRKPRLLQMGKGGLVYGIASEVGWLAAKVAATVSGASYRVVSGGLR